MKGGLDILPNHNDGSVKTMVIHNPGNIEENKMYIFLFYFGLKCRFEIIRIAFKERISLSILYFMFMVLKL